MKLLIIGGDRQPIPPIHGGAVENLVKIFYEENEETENEISVVGCEDSKLNLTKENVYKKCRFYTAKKSENKHKLFAFFTRVVAKILKIQILNKTEYPQNIIDAIENNKIEFDTIIVENYINAIVPLHKKYPNKKIFFHIHNDKLNNKLFGCKEIVNSCYRIITVSDYIKNRVCTIPNAKNKTYTLINSIDVKKFGKENYSKSLKKNLGIKDDETVIIFAGRISKTKGIKELIQALARIKNEKFKLVVVGNSWYGTTNYKDSFFEEVKQLSKEIEDKIIFTGYIDYNDIPKYYAIADISIVPSIWQEPCSLALFESMASELLLITTNTGGTPEVVKDNAIILDVNKNFVNNLSDEIKNAISDKKIVKNYSKKAHEYIQYYNPKRYYCEFVNILERGKNND
jgi:glycosyltransferase involved in cell wall biosynthesis